MRQNLPIATTRKRTKTASMSRTERMRRSLGSALIDLLTERGFDSITVQDVLDRAGVARSTFYVHYDGKDDLFASDVERFWGMIADAIRDEASDRVVPVRELLEHVATTRDFQRALRASGKHSQVFEAGKIHIARGIEQRLARSPRAKHIRRAELPAIAMMHAAALLSLVEWWLQEPQTMSAAEADALFHRLLWKSLDT